MSGEKRRRVLRFGLGSAQDLRYAENLRKLLALGVPFDMVKDAALGHRYAVKQRARSRAGVATKADARARSDDALRGQLASLRRAHPHASTRTLARMLLGRVPSGPDGAKRLDAMRKRIERLEKK